MSPHAQHGACAQDCWGCHWQRMQPQREGRKDGGGREGRYAALALFFKVGLGCPSESVPACLCCLCWRGVCCLGRCPAGPIPETSVPWDPGEMRLLRHYPPPHTHTHLSPVDPPVGCEVQGSHCSLLSRQGPHLCGFPVSWTVHSTDHSPAQYCRDMCAPFCAALTVPGGPSWMPGLGLWCKVTLSPPLALDQGEESFCPWEGAQLSPQREGDCLPDASGRLSCLTVRASGVSPGWPRSVLPQRVGPLAESGVRDLRRAGAARTPLAARWTPSSELGLSEPIALAAGRLAFEPDSGRMRSALPPLGLCTERPTPRAQGPLDLPLGQSWKVGMA